jgi:hypothetical protein
MLGGWFYLKKQPLKNQQLGYLLAFMRGLLLCLILLYLAEPTLNLRVTTHPKPALWLLVDGSASMAIEDDAAGSRPRRKPGRSANRRLERPASRKCKTCCGNRTMRICSRA